MLGIENREGINLIKAANMNGRNHRSLIWLILILCGVASRVDAGDDPARLQETAVQDWNALRSQVLELSQLTDAPKMYEAEGFAAEGDIKPIYFDGLPWQGKPTRIFAWLGMPQPNLENPGGKVPGVVLVHGGGGTAFKEWVKKWNEQGCAAISIAVEGQTDRRDASGKSWERHDWAGPARVGIYGDTDEPLADQWMYHAVADTVLANSLLRNLPQVDSDRVGVMGISWGGVITSTVIGVDDRFSFAIPTYGCGGLATSQNQYGRALGENSFYQEVWDPLVRMKRAKMPVLWLSWTGDLHFPLDAQSRCYTTAPGPHLLALLPNMRHGHAPGWNPPDSYAFAKSVVDTGTPWCEQLGVKVDGDVARISFDSNRPIEQATLVTTTGMGFTGDREWSESPANLRQNQTRVIVEATIPPGTTAWFTRLKSGGLIACSDFHETEQGVRNDLKD
ncbi:MAG: acetylxylan esterase [Planctomycetaceae bacterium]|nr:acetylxylan esterase [Planctomycetaceae bacterium]